MSESLPPLHRARLLALAGMLFLGACEGQMVTERREHAGGITSRIARHGERDLTIQMSVLPLTMTTATSVAMLRAARERAELECNGGVEETIVTIRLANGMVVEAICRQPHRVPR